MSDEKVKVTLGWRIKVKDQWLSGRVWQSTPPRPMSWMSLIDALGICRHYPRENVKITRVTKRVTPEIVATIKHDSGGVFDFYEPSDTRQAKTVTMLLEKCRTPRRRRPCTASASRPSP